MMSAAILLPSDAKQTSLQPASSDMSSNHIESQDLSFAKKFSERVDNSTMLNFKASGVESVLPQATVKRMGLTKKADELVQILDGEPLGGRKISAQGELRDTVAVRIVQPQATALAEKQGKMPVGNFPAKEVIPPAQTEETISEAETTPPQPAAIPASRLRVDASAQPIVTSGSSRLLTSGGDGPAVPNQMKVEKEAKELTPAKRIAKPQGSAAARSVQKPIQAAVTGIEKEATPTVGSPTVTLPPPVVEHAPMTEIVSRNESGKTIVEGDKTVSEIVKIQTGVVSANMDSSASNGKDTGERTDAVAAGAELPVPVASNQGTREKPDVDSDKTMTVAVPVVRDSSKTQAEPDLSVTVVRAASVGVGATLGLVSGVATPEELRDVISGKLTASDAGVHQTAAQLVESREQGGSGGVAAAVDGMPRMLTATPTTLEVGIANGTHGWLKVRAEMVDGGGVHASVSTASPAGLEILHKELPSLTTYLQQEKVAVNSVAIHAVVIAPMERRGSNADMGGTGQTSHNSDGRERPQSNSRAATVRDGEGIAYPEDGSDESSLPGIYGGGGWLSVRA
jgi:hypothetical protein